MGERKHLPAQQVTELKAKYLTAAYTTRITSIMNGIPGVVDPDPHLAEAMFKQVQSQLGPQAQVQLAEQVKKSNNDWTDTTIAKTMIFGGGPSAKNDSGLPANPTANDLKVDLGKRVQAALDLYPNDPLRGRALAAKVENYGRMVISNQEAVQRQAGESLLGGVVGTKPDGSDGAQTMDQLMLNPQNKKAWDVATPETRAAIQQRLAKGNKAMDQDGLNTYYGLLGKSTSDTEGFMNEDLSKYFGQMPDHLLLSLMGQQKSINKNDAAQQAKSLNWQGAKSAVEDMLKPIGLGTTAKTGSANGKTTEVFYGKLQDAMQTYHDQNGNKWPDAVQTRKIGASLLLQGKQSGGMVWDSTKRAFEAEDPSKFYVPVPSDRKAELTSAFTKAYGRAPTDAELRQKWTQYTLAGGK
jgi:soluble lytic murein transglycosylase